MRQHNAPKYVPLETHKYHQVEIRPSQTMHEYMYYCSQCQKFVGWLSKTERALYLKIKKIL